MGNTFFWRRMYIKFQLTIIQNPLWEHMCLILLSQIKYKIAFGSTWLWASRTPPSLIRTPAPNPHPKHIVNKKSSRSASDGLVTVKIEKNSGVILEVNAETDFVARNENFQTFCDELATTCLNNRTKSLNDLLVFLHY